MNKSAKWSLAAKYGLLLSLVTIIIELIKTTFSLPLWLNYVLIVTKIAATIYLLYIFMKNYSTQCEGDVSYSQSFNFGFITCLCSSVVCTLFYFINYNFINPEIMEATMEQLSVVASSYGDIIDLDKIEGLLPNITLLSAFIDCIIFGLIFPAILASYTKKEVFE